MGLFSKLIVGLMASFALVAVIDKLLFNNKLLLWQELEKGFNIIGPLCLSFTGIICLVPELSWLIEKTISPLYMKLGLDPSFAVGAVLALDMGGYQLATSVAIDPLVGQWAGLVYGSMMGATMIFTIPIAFRTLNEKTLPAFTKGVLFGIITVPIGTAVSGLMMGLSVSTVFRNLIIPVLLSLLIAFFMSKYPSGTFKVFKGFGKAVNCVSLLGLALAFFSEFVLSSFTEVSAVPFFNRLAPLSDGVQIAGSIGIFLAGALPFVSLVNRLVEKNGKTNPGRTGLLLSSANNVPMLAMMSSMNEKEIIINAAWCVSASFIIGDHLAFAAATAKNLIPALLVGKAVSAFFAVGLARGKYRR